MDEADDELLSQRAEELCAHLLIFTYLPKSSCRDLVLNDALRTEVTGRLSGVGLELVDSAYSAYVAVRLKRKIESDVTFDWSTNLRLNKGAVALLVVLWAKLVLPKRVAMERRETPGEQSTDLFPETKRARMVALSVHRDALYAEFGEKFGKVNFQRYVGQLRNLGFITEDRAGNIGEGPLLDLMIDSNEMAMKLKDSVLWDLLGDSAQTPPPADAARADRAEAVPDDVGFPEGFSADSVHAELDVELDDPWGLDSPADGASAPDGFPDSDPDEEV
jgi:hypothetical protein